MEAHVSSVERELIEQTGDSEASFGHDGNFLHGISLALAFRQL